MPATPTLPAGRNARPPSRSLGRRLALAMALLLGLAALLLALAVAWALPQLPPLDRVLNYQPRQPLQVFTAEGVEIAQFGNERRRFVPISQIPPMLQQAVLAVEDSRFHQHPGIDPLGLARALLAKLSGGLRQGASTITQQVARNFFLSSRFSAERKLKEALLALRIERQLGKDQILELYLNQIYLGQRAYGFAAAADTYFGKPLAALSIAECAMLAGLPQNPAYANPITNLARATQRQRIVLQRMLAVGAISPAQREQARSEQLLLRDPLQQPLPAGHVAEMVRATVVERFGQQAYEQGIQVHTTLRAADQQAAHAALRRQVLAYDARQPWRGPEGQEDLPPETSPDIERAAALALRDHADDEQLRLAIVRQVARDGLLVQLASGELARISGDGLRVALPGLAAHAVPALALRRGSVLRVWQPAARPGAAAPVWAVVQWPEVQAALVALDAASGQIRALVGGFDFARQNFNHVTQAWRQPGSALKPFLYSAALEQGVMPATLVNDAPLDGADGWDPQNSDGRFDGPITVREGLVRSKNLVSIRLLRQIGLPAARDGLARFGFDMARQPIDLTLALGTGSTTPLQLAQAYAVLANGGWPVVPLLIQRISDARGQPLFEAPAPVAMDATHRVLPARNAFVINSLLADVTRSGTAAAAQARLGRPDLYGKTGTTNDAVDAWFAGFQGGGEGRPGLVAVAWMGHDRPASLGPRESGAGLALPIWVDYMAQALKGVAVAAAPQPPDGLVLRDGDWVYREWADGGAVTAIGFPTPGLPAPAETAASAAPVPAPAASH